jgi:hypothetical protein
LTLGLALASISALDRRNRIVMVFDVTQSLYHTVWQRARPHPPGPPGPKQGGHRIELQVSAAVLDGLTLMRHLQL